MMFTPSSAVAEELWRNAGSCGFLQMEDSCADFDSRIHSFLSTHLVHKPEAPFTRRTLENILNTNRKLVIREEVVRLELINELTIVWACNLLRLGYRGLTNPEVIDHLKNEVVWLLEKFGYKLHPHHTVFCPILNIWENQPNWQVVRDNDRGERGNPIALIKPLLPAFICRECIEDVNTVHQS